MALVQVIRRVPNEDLAWATYTIDETELLPGEVTVAEQQAIADIYGQSFDAPAEAV